MKRGTQSKKNKKKESLSHMEEYSAKLITAEEAAGLINSNDRLFTGGGVNIPKGFSTALGARARDLSNVTIYQGFAMDAIKK
jgi:acyl-CoA hydrolase